MMTRNVKQANDLLVLREELQDWIDTIEEQEFNHIENRGRWRIDLTRIAKGVDGSEEEETFVESTRLIAPALLVSVLRLGVAFAGDRLKALGVTDDGEGKDGKPA